MGITDFHHDLFAAEFEKLFLVERGSVVLLYNALWASLVRAATAAANFLVQMSRKAKGACAMQVPRILSQNWSVVWLPEGRNGRHDVASWPVASVRALQRYVRSWMRSGSAQRGGNCRRTQ